MKIFVNDVVVRARAVEIPETCPSCGADLHEPGALRLWEFMGQARAACLSPARGARDHGYGACGASGLLYGDGGSCGEGCIDAVAVVCRCSEVLAEGTLEIVGAP